ncbi:tannase/feruloyl esterase family alpha/beta hydrolase [Agrobacterium rhizogenes]|uniref:tannase/feruloyl esterase family alpha/beta hydrolase n=1 Tax=Rhizobium rhizogenes TaxID=359 RepID=UPI00115E68DF|nr:tannase/feruloyl esterase family alpha/beta hydrolase [Rhizobium rhizogenes]NTG90915.1 tannase/feruloyl esterase family alpha/beta hydrolase [Rhizobium rhizogenes]NTI20188.1 tannase/feruloyl esterase family alpha/beta hydrolase [Rhizobium rhizogenes]NTI39236.1 tannase/feruloyl esterase family alpha/beta hydrolase [Rhizobium rhizogenes]TRB19789.1 tannase/feruloyl esterase family alpha/beta hydrolase [Rhizobium rhizogenes]WEO69048.1 tannase/feruloyl esterase family alpha/beta hydrolase [Rhizo
MRKLKAVVTLAFLALFMLPIVGNIRPAHAAESLHCDDTLKSKFKADDTRVLLVKHFSREEKISLSGSPEPSPEAYVDMCLVKLLVGPGKAGTAGLKSTSDGIGIEVWLPSPDAWNRIIRVTGSGGFAGGYQSKMDRIGNAGWADPITLAAVAKGYVVSSSDHGHLGQATSDGSFALDEDGGINTVLWHDFAERSLHELAVKTKQLAAVYYGKSHLYVYWDGFSTGGRQGLKLAQKYPDDFDGILAGAPAINWTRFITAELYPQLVMQKMFAGPIDTARLNAVSAAATAQCGGKELGFLLDPTQCRYDPSQDIDVLCSSETLNGAPGKGDAATCITLTQAEAVNRIWFGLSSDGSYIDPKMDNGMSAMLSGSHLWWGLTRGTSLARLAGEKPFPIASTMVALELQDARYAQAGLFPEGPIGKGMDRWKMLDYGSLADAYALGLLLQGPFSNINTDDPDLRAFRNSKAKLITYHGWNDDLIMPQGSLNYFNRASASMGGITRLKEFYRLFMIPGLAHDGTFARAGSIDPVTGQPTDVAKVPLPQSATGRDELFIALRRWVEEGKAPSRMDIRSANGSVTMPLCDYPRKPVWNHTGSIGSRESYSCE